MGLLIWGGVKGLQLWVHETTFFLCYYLLIIVLFSIWTTVNLLLPHSGIISLVLTIDSLKISLYVFENCYFLSDIWYMVITSVLENYIIFQWNPLS